MEVKNMSKRINAIAIAVLMTLCVFSAIPASATTIQIRGEAFDQATGHVPAGVVSVNTSAGRFEDTLINQNCQVNINFTTGKWNYTTETGCPGSAAPLGVTWSAYNFGPFWYDLDTGQTSESLQILTTTLDDNHRDIAKDELIYTTSDMFVEYELSKSKPDYARDIEEYIPDPNDANNTGYSKIGWLGEEYVALDGKATKLSKLIIEDGSSASEKHSLNSGDSWKVGDWELTVQQVDARASPRKAWFVLSYKGQKLDDAVVSDQGDNRVYTYVEENIQGETKVPMFVTYIDSIFSGTNSDMIQLRYTWAISREIQKISSDDDIGVFKVTSAGEDKIVLKNDDSVSLTQDSIVDLGGGLKFSVADDDNYLRFFPITEKTIVGEGVVTTVTPTATVVTPGKTPTTTVTVTTPPVVTTTAAATVTTAAPVKTEKEPGFEAIFAIAGLLAVAFLVLRQRK
jgi:S-layer protein (TIGR01567 family)